VAIVRNFEVISENLMWWRSALMVIIHKNEGTCILMGDPNTVKFPFKVCLGDNYCTLNW
jgi:hypothetical protein